MNIHTNNPNLRVVWSLTDQEKPVDISKLTDEEKEDLVIEKLKHTSKPFLQFQIGETIFINETNVVMLYVGNDHFVEVGAYRNGNNIWI